MTACSPANDFAEFLKSLSETERDFLAELDSGREPVEHRRQLDIVISNGGIADLSVQSWHPYEVIDLGKHLLFPGHENEFVACNGIVLLNIATGNDHSNDFDWVFSNFMTYESELEHDLVEMVQRIASMIDCGDQLDAIPDEEISE